jgi:hypothetical protein
MATAIFHYKSIGKNHPEESDFFKFLIRQQFSYDNNRAYNWCEFDGLKVICSALEPSVIDFAKQSLIDFIETDSGYRYELVTVTM